MIFQPHRFSRTKAYWRSFIKTLNALDQIILLPTYSAGEKNNTYDSNFLYRKLSNKNKTLLRSFRSIKKLLGQLDLKNTILVLQGAGDIKNIINILEKHESL